MGENIDVIREEVENGLSAVKIEGLGEVCTEIDLQIPTDVQGSRNKLYRHLLTHLWAEGDKEDGGFATHLFDPIGGC